FFKFTFNIFYGISAVRNFKRNLLCCREFHPFPISMKCYLYNKGRNDENGNDGIKNLTEICNLISINGYNTKVVAASIKNVFHLT
ncbi:hypothetical protein ACTPEF_23955, partial [Clostridioides difficile]